MLFKKLTPTKCNASVKLVANRQKQPFTISITFTRNGMTSRREVHDTSDFIYFMFDLIYSNSPISDITVTQNDEP